MRTEHYFKYLCFDMILVVDDFDIQEDGDVDITPLYLYYGKPEQRFSTF